MFRGLNRKLATEFSFLLALPATFGAAILGIRDAVAAGGETQFTAPLVVGVVISAIVGVFAMKILMSLLENKKLHYFSYYLWVLGTILLISQIF